jgi:hypothetical protein
MMTRKAISILLLGAMFYASPSWATGPYEAYVDRLQATDVGNPYNTVFLTLNITNSPCTSTNDYDRFTITSKVQYATLLAAVMANKKVRIFGTGVCNTADVEDISNVQIFPSQ